MGAISRGARRAYHLLRVRAVSSRLDVVFADEAYPALFRRLATLARAGKIHFDREDWQWKLGLSPVPPPEMKLTAATEKYEALDNAILAAIADGVRGSHHIYDVVEGHIENPDGTLTIIDKRVESLKRRGFIHYSHVRRRWSIAEDIRFKPTVTTKLPRPKRAAPKKSNSRLPAE